MLLVNTVTHLQNLLSFGKIKRMRQKSLLASHFVSLLEVLLTNYDTYLCLRAIASATNPTPNPKTTTLGSGTYAINNLGRAASSEDSLEPKP